MPRVFPPCYQSTGRLTRPGCCWMLLPTWHNTFSLIESDMSRTATRTFDLFEAVVRSPVPLGLMDIAESTGVDKSTAQRLLTFLVEREMLTRDGAKRYGPGSGAFALAASIGARSDLRTVVAPVMRDLRDASGETVSLHLAVGSRRVCVDGLESPAIIRRVVPLGDSLWLHEGPSGKAILAYLPEPRIEEVLDEAGVKRVDRKNVRDDLARMRADGVITTEGDRSPGVRAVSAALFDVRGVTASLTVAGPADRFTAEDADRIGARMLHSADDISRSLGGRRP